MLRSPLPVIALLLVLLGSCSDSSRNNQAPTDLASLPHVESAESGALTTTVARETLGQGGTLGASLERLGLDADLRTAVLATVGRHLDVRRLKPQTGLAATRAADGQILAVTVRDRADRYLRVRIDGDGTQTELRSLPLRRAVRHDGGTIESSVAQALGHLPNAISVTAAFADVMQWDVDLYVDPRPGDTVRLVYEVMTLGAVPDDLPDFGRAAREPGEFVALGRVLAARYRGAIASAEGFWVADGSGAGDFFDRAGQPLRKSFLKSPLNYRRISSRFSRNRLHPVTRRVSPHHGVDFAAAPGTPVVATADGRVTRAGWDGPLGRAVRVRHNGEYTTVYGHFQRLARGIRPGVSVKQNQVIGFVGSSGRATGPHLHYTVLRAGRAIDPLRMDNPSREPLTPSLRPWLAQAAARWGELLDQEDENRDRERQIAAGSGDPGPVGIGS